MTFNPLLPGTSASVSHVRFFLLSLFNKADLYRLLHQSQLLLIQKRQKKDERALGSLDVTNKIRKQYIDMFSIRLYQTI